MALRNNNKYTSVEGQGECSFFEGDFYTAIPIHSENWEQVNLRIVTRLRWSHHIKNHPPCTECCGMKKSTKSSYTRSHSQTARLHSVRWFCAASPSCYSVSSASNYSPTSAVLQPSSEVSAQSSALTLNRQLVKNNQKHN